MLHHILDSNINNRFHIIHLLPFMGVEKKAHNINLKNKPQRGNTRKR
jgi:hypothetical protein